MRRGRSQLVLLLVGGLALVATSFASGSGGHQATSKASLKLVDMSPMTVAGSGFLPRERVTVRLSTGGGEALSRTRRANLNGRITAQFEGATVPECTAVNIIATATGARSGRVAQVRMLSIPPPCGMFPQP
jgi:hypothetical protein